MDLRVVALVVVAAVILLPELRLARHQLAYVVHIDTGRVHAVLARLAGLTEVLILRTRPSKRCSILAVGVLLALGGVGHPHTVLAFATVAAILVAVGQRGHAGVLAGTVGLAGGTGQDSALAVDALDVLVAGPWLADLGAVLEQAAQLLVFASAGR